jgi:Ca2+-binding RTX toxin-like protein
VAIDPTKPGSLPNSLGALVDQSTGTPFSNTNPSITSKFFNDATKGNPTLFSAPPAGFSAGQFTSVATTSTYDDLKVKQILNEIDGLDHTGTTAAGTPAIFGMNFQAVSVAEKEPGSQFNGGGIDSKGNARPDLVSAVAHTDASIGLILNELKKKGLDSSTLVVLTAKHGQNPVQDPTIGLNSTFDSTTGAAGGDGNLTAFGALLVQNGIPIVSERGGDTSSLIYLANPTQDLAKAVALLNTKNYSFDNTPDKTSDPTGNTLFSTEDAAAQGTVLSGQAIINAGLGNPATNDRTPDIVVPLNTGYFFGSTTKKRAEHGGFTDADTHVALIVGSTKLSSSLQGTTNNQNVSTTQIAPTTLEALGLDPKRLQGVQIDGTQDLRGLINNSTGNTIKGTSGNDVLTGGVGNDTIYGYGGDNLLIGGGGNDALFAGRGNNTLIGVDPNSANPGQGEIDVLTGGKGPVVFALGDSRNVYYDAGNNANPGVSDYALITNFNSAKDKIQLKAGLSYVIGSAPSGLPSGAGIYIDNDGIPGLSANDELIGILQGVSSTNPTAISSRFSFV